MLQSVRIESQDSRNPVTIATLITQSQKRYQRYQFFFRLPPSAFCSMTLLPEMPKNVSTQTRLSILGIRNKVQKIKRSKLLQGLAAAVKIDEVLPLLGLNRDNVARLVGVSTTTWKGFAHKKLGIKRWPGRTFRKFEDTETYLHRRLAFAEKLNDTADMETARLEMKQLKETMKKEIDEIKETSRKFQQGEIERQEDLDG